MPYEATAFTKNQILAMVESGKTLDIVDAATSNYITQATNPNLTFVGKLMAEEQVAARRFTVSSNNLTVYLQRHFADEDPKMFGDFWGSSFEGPDHAAYREIEVAFAGVIRAGFSGTGRKEHYTAYRINQPNGHLHNLGLFVASINVHKREIIPLDPNDVQLNRSFKIAIQRLFALSANSPNTEQAKRFEQAAEAATKQKSIVSDSYEPENGYSILDARGARQLSDTIRFALDYGQENSLFV